MAKTSSVQQEGGMKAKRTVLSVLATGWFAILSIIIVYPLFAGLVASFRPGRELIRRGLSVDLDFSTMTLNNYTYLFGGNEDSQKYFMWFKNSLILTFISVVLTLFISCMMRRAAIIISLYPMEDLRGRVDIRSACSARRRSMEIMWI